MSILEANEYMKAKNINIFETLHFVNKAWNNVSDVTIRNCFYYGGFVEIEEA